MESISEVVGNSFDVSKTGRLRDLELLDIDTNMRKKNVTHHRDQSQ